MDSKLAMLFVFWLSRWLMGVPMESFNDQLSINLWRRSLCPTSYYFRFLRSVGISTWYWLLHLFTGETKILKILRIFTWKQVTAFWTCVIFSQQYLPSTESLLLHEILWDKKITDIIIKIMCPRVLLRSVQIFSCDVRYFMMKMTMYKYLTNNKHIKHIKHYVRNCRYLALSKLTKIWSCSHLWTRTSSLCHQHHHSYC